MSLKKRPNRLLFCFQTGSYACCAFNGKRCLTSTKTAKRKKIAETVAGIIAPITPVPTAYGVLVLVPLLATIGSTSKINASDAIKIDTAANGRPQRVFTG